MSTMEHAHLFRGSLSSQVTLQYRNHALPILAPVIDGAGYRCGYAGCKCKTLFKMLKDLWRHQSSVHLEKKAMCPCCNAVMTRFDSLKRHITMFRQCGEYVLAEVNLFLAIKRHVGGIDGPESERVTKVKALSPGRHLAQYYEVLCPRNGQ